ncbi:MAG TPA: hypothetical protein PLT38_02405, partial [Rubrivivax sp.]|nr:hypothetical protein [Rubrivivax sp.]
MQRPEGNEGGREEEETAPGFQPDRPAAQQETLCAPLLEERHCGLERLARREFRRRSRKLEQSRTRAAPSRRAGAPDAQVRAAAAPGAAACGQRQGEQGGQ